MPEIYFDCPVCDKTYFANKVENYEYNRNKAKIGSIMGCQGCYNLYKVMAVEMQENKNIRIIVSPFARRIEN
jgi:uncharacterized Zn finger protein